MDCKPATRQRKCALELLANDAAKPLAYGHMGAGGTRRVLRLGIRLPEEGKGRVGGRGEGEAGTERGPDGRPDQFIIHN